VLGDVRKPAAKKVKCQERNDNSAQGVRIKPIYQSKVIFPTPITQQYDDYGQDGMNGKMNECKANVNRRVANLVFLVRHWQQRNGSFNDPENEQAAYNEGHPFKGPLFKG
jgi:hypothetical protein